MQKELMGIEDFMEIYSVTRSRFYSEVKKFPWLPTKIGKRTYVRRLDADKWIEAIKVCDISALSTGVFC